MKVQAHGGESFELAESELVEHVSLELTLMSLRGHRRFGIATEQRIAVYAFYCEPDTQRRAAWGEACLEDLTFGAVAISVAAHPLQARSMLPLPVLLEAGAWVRGQIVAPHPDRFLFKFRVAGMAVPRS